MSGASVEGLNRQTIGAPEFMLSGDIHWHCTNISSSPLKGKSAHSQKTFLHCFAKKEWPVIVSNYEICQPDGSFEEKRSAIVSPFIRESTNDFRVTRSYFSTTKYLRVAQSAPTHGPLTIAFCIFFLRPVVALMDKKLNKCNHSHLKILHTKQRLEAANIYLN